MIEQFLLLGVMIFTACALFVVGMALLLTIVGLFIRLIEKLTGLPWLEPQQ